MATNNQTPLLLVAAGLGGLFWAVKSGKLSFGQTDTSAPSPGLSPGASVITTPPIFVQVQQPQVGVVGADGTIVTPSNFDACLPGMPADVCGCMRNKKANGWTVTQCEARISALRTKRNNVVQEMARINSLGNLDAQVAAANAFSSPATVLRNAIDSAGTLLTAYSNWVSPEQQRSYTAIKNALMAQNGNPTSSAQVVQNYLQYLALERDNALAEHLKITGVNLG
jgi:hypothetical protein